MKTAASKKNANIGRRERTVDVKELLKKGYIVLDGAMGTMLQAAGMKMGETPEVLSITQPQAFSRDS